MIGWQMLIGRVKITSSDDGEVLTQSKCCINYVSTAGLIVGQNIGLKDSLRKTYKFVTAISSSSFCDKGI